MSSGLDHLGKIIDWRQNHFIRWIHFCPQTRPVNDLRLDLCPLPQNSGYPYWKERHLFFGLSITVKPFMRSDNPSIGRYNFTRLILYKIRQKFRNFDFFPENRSLGCLFFLPQADFSPSANRRTSGLLISPRGNRAVCCSCEKMGKEVGLDL